MIQYFSYWPPQLIKEQNKIVKYPSLWKANQKAIYKDTKIDYQPQGW